ncbi:MAG: galactokinase [Aquiluna sp.]|nr:galactokinase [Aquiluna sp.]MCF8545985.1 galactokinase [Aquiluna sp.]
MSLKEQVVASFENTFGHQPDGVWSAPGRANLIGEHTDYNLGFVLPFGINFRTYVAVAKRADRKCRVASTIDSKIYEFDLDGEMPKNLDWALYPLGVAWVMRENADFGFDAFFDSNVPIGAGLSSSAAIECSIALALNEIWNTNHTKQELALIGQKAENQVVGAPTGMMDQTASMLAQSDGAVLLDCKKLETKVIDLGLTKNNLVIAVIDTKVAHRHSDGGYRSRRDSCELGAKTLGVESLRELSLSDLPRAQSQLDDLTYRRVKHIITENQRVLDSVSALRDGNLESLGRLLLESHSSMRDDFEISVPELDLAVETAMEVGAIGSRMTGGGFGGAAIALIAESKLGELEIACKKAFEANSYAEPNIFAVVPSEGARKDS